MPTNKVEGAKILDPKDVFLSNEPKDIPPLPGQLDIEKVLRDNNPTFESMDCTCVECTAKKPMGSLELYEKLREIASERS